MIESAYTFLTATSKCVFVIRISICLKAKMFISWNFPELFPLYKSINQVGEVILLLDAVALRSHNSPHQYYNQVEANIWKGEIQFAY